MSFVLVPFPLLSSPNCECVSSVTETPSVDEDIMGWKGLMTSIITFYGAGKKKSIISVSWRPVTWQVNNTCSFVVPDVYSELVVEVLASGYLEVSWNSFNSISCCPDNAPAA